MTTQRLEKYACLELERRYLLRELPAGLEGQGYYWTITDRYLVGTRLRLRRMVAPGGEFLFKFGQKYRAPSQSPFETTMTNIYLNEVEYHSLSGLEAREITKRRYRYVYGQLEYGIDIFEGHLRGLILAEIECETEAEVGRLQNPDFAIKDVTEELFFTGGFLARLTRADFLAGFTERRLE